MNKLLFFIFFIFSISSIVIALPKCEGKIGKCSGSKTYKNGKYVGDFINGIRNGYFVTGIRHGHGSFYWNKGETYIGDWVNDYRTGRGTYLWKNGDEYVGDFVLNYITGEGIVTRKSGEKIEGFFKNNNLVLSKCENNVNKCRSVYVDSSGSKYYGHWVNQKIIGKGLVLWNFGDIYVGDFKGNIKDGLIRSGKGKYSWKNGDEYEGDFLNGGFTGIGKYTSNDGEKYVGDFLNDLRNGRGTLYLINGDKYTGDWVNNKRIGKGTYLWKNGDKYVGDFINGKKTGKGTFTTQNNEYYIGNFVNGKLNGAGTFISPKGIKKVGFFRDNKFLFTNQEWEKTKSNLCSNLLKSAKDGNVIDWKIFSQKAEGFIKLISKDDFVNCYNRTKKIYASTPKQNFKIVNPKEYNSRPSVGFSNLHPAIKFILKTDSIGSYGKFSAVEEASRCKYKARYDLPNSWHENYGEIAKEYIDFNKVNWNTREVDFDGYRTRIKYSCKKNCFFSYDSWNERGIIKWTPRKYVNFSVKKSDNMYSRLKKALVDLSKVCNTGTSQY